MVTPTSNSPTRPPGRFVSFLMRRYGSVATPYASAGGVLYGLLLLVGDPSDFVTPALVGGPFQLAPRWAWGVVFLAAGLVALIWVQAWAVAAMSGCLLAWASSVFVAALTQPGVPPTGPIWSAVVAATLATSVAIRGVGRHRGRR